MTEKRSSPGTQPATAEGRTDETLEPRDAEPIDAASFDPHQAVGGSTFAGPLESGATMAVGGSSASPAALEHEGVDRGT